MKKESQSVPVSVKGKIVFVPGVQIQGRRITITGKLIKIATVFDEEWLPGETFSDPEAVIKELKVARPRPDLLSFAPSEPDPHVKFPYHTEWDNVAVIDTTDYNDWWKNLSQDARRNVRLATKRGVTVRQVKFDEQLAVGIKRIYDETPIRQGRRFWHYGKELSAVKEENSTYLERSEYLGAYLDDELVGFIKMVYVGKTARIMQILSMNHCFDKKVTNALIAKAVEISCENKMTYLAYCRYVYGTKKNSSVTEFKRRNRFKELRFPRYYVPLTVMGRLLIRLRLHRGVRAAIPEPVVDTFLTLRSKYHGLSAARNAS